MESLSAELRSEKQLSISARNMTKRTSKENVAIKRAIQSLGCKFHFSDNGDCIFDIENNLAGAAPAIMYPSTKKDSDSTLHDDKRDLSVSATVTADDDFDDDANNAFVRVCEALCQCHSRNGCCKWPNAAGCAQLSSQLVGVKANFDAFDQLSIDDSYFKSG